MIQSGASFDIILKKKNFLWKKELNYVTDKSLTVDFHPGNTLRNISLSTWRLS